MPISAHVLLCAPEDRARVLSQLRDLPGVEAGTPTGTGIPVVTDTPTTRLAEELGARLATLTGVRSAVLVYHNFEDSAESAGHAKAWTPERAADRSEAARRSASPGGTRGVAGQAGVCCPGFSRFMG